MRGVERILLAGELKLKGAMHRFAKVVRLSL